MRRSRSFCTMNYGVKFPMFGKITVTGKEKHPLYSTLIAAQPKAVTVNEPSWREKLRGWGMATLEEPELLWNFEKFLVSRTGEVVKRFAPDTAADAPELVAAIEKQLRKS